MTSCIDKTVSISSDPFLPRRILCNVIGQWVENGEVIADFKLLGQIVEDISFNNTNKYFGFGL